MTDSATPAPALDGGPLERAAALAFVLLAAVLPWTIAPMGIATGLCGVLTIAALVAGRARWTRTPLDLPAIAWALALGLAAWFALDRAASLPRLGKALFPALAGLAALHASREATGRHFLAAFLASGAAAAAYGLAAFVAHGAGFDGRARGAVGHYMTFAGQLLLLAGVALGVALAGRERRWRLGSLAAALPAAAALAATFTRSAWLGLLAALATMLGFSRPRWLPALAVLAALATAIAPGPYRARIASVIDPASPWNRERTFMWAAGVRMFADHPITGVGLMDLKPVYERYRPPEAHEPAGHLHSVPIQIAATTGVLGLAAFVALAVGLLACAMHGLRAQVKRGGLAAGVRLGVAGAVVGFLVAGLFEWNLGDEELLYPLYTLAGLAWAARGWMGGPERARAPEGTPRGRAEPGGARMAVPAEQERGAARIAEPSVPRGVPPGAPARPARAAASGPSGPA
jgi:O-antigen ligase